MRPHELVLVQMDGYQYIGETISYPTPDEIIMVRRAPGDPATLEEVSTNRVSPLLDKKRRTTWWVHYARVSGSGSFPVDMLRYERAAPVNFRLVPRGRGIPSFLAERTDLTRGLAALDGLFVASLHEQKNAPYAWTPERWASFGWSCIPVKVLRYEVSK